MSDANRIMRWPLIGGLVAVGVACGYLIGQNTVPPPAKVAASSINPQTRALDADVWIQTSAEYDACCLQTYRFAWERLQERLAKMDKSGKPPAIIMDLDETVLDNSVFQTWMYRFAVPYEQKYWDRWEETHPLETRLMPGAGEFIRKAEEAAVTVTYVTNRNQRTIDATRRAMGNLGINVTDFEKRFFGTSETIGSDKTSRRAEVAKEYQVLMLLGDNLRDFSEEFRAAKVDPKDGEALRKAIAERKRKVEELKDKFGAEWIIFPNPVYGEWTKLQGDNPLDVLNLSEMTGPSDAK